MHSEHTSQSFDLFDEPLSDQERVEIAAMPSHELYFLTKMVPPATVRGREVNRLYLECIDRAIRAGDVV